MILGHLDTFLAFAAVMVGVSLLITILTQLISVLLGSRGTNLKWGLKALLQTVDPRLGEHAETIADSILHHPLISDSTFSKFQNKMPLLGRLINRWTLASAIRQEELVRILQSLPTDGISQHADIPKEAVGNLEQWFNSTMDRVSQRFAVQMRLWTVVFSVIIAFALHLDTFNLLIQLSNDVELRASLVASAEVMTKQADDVLQTSRDPVLLAALSTQLNALKDQAVSIKSTLDQTKFQLIPDPYHGWDFWPGWTFSNRHFWGILVSSALLSLGAPFWFNILKTLSNLRPILAGKVQKEQESATD